MHLLLPLSCALLLWSVWSGDAGSTESPPGSASVLLPPSREASSSGRETHLRLLPGDGCTPKTQLQEFCSATGFFFFKKKDKSGFFLGSPALRSLEP